MGKRKEKSPSVSSDGSGSASSSESESHNAKSRQDDRFARSDSNQQLALPAPEGFFAEPPVPPVAPATLVGGQRKRKRTRRL